MPRTGFVVIVIALGLAGAGSVASARVAQDAAPASRGSTGPVDSSPFAPGSFWRTRVDAATPIDPASGTLVSRLAAQAATYRSSINTTSYSAPVYDVPADQPRVRVALDADEPALQSAFDSVPIPAGARGSAGTDGTAIVWQRSTDTLWELWRLRKDLTGAWHARWGGRITDVSQSDGIYPAPYGVAASGLSILGGMMRPAEFASGDIGHALSIAVPQVTAWTFRAPATRTDGRVIGGGIPLGTRFRLDPSVDVSTLGLPAAGKEIALAAQRYGLVVTDRAGCVCFGAQDPISLPSNPWPTLFGGLPAWQILEKFPWGRLQALAVPGS